MTAATVWKYMFSLGDEPQILMPAGARIVHADCEAPSSPTGHPGVFVVWAVVDPTAPPVVRNFVLRGTGHPLPEVGAHIATFRDGPFVWHLFEQVIA